MPVLLTGKLSTSSFAHISSGGNGRTETALRSVSVSSSQSYNDCDSKRKDSSMPHMSIIRENSVTPVNAQANNANRKVTSVQSDTCLKRIKRSYKHLHLNHLLSLVFMMIYMLIGALLFLWLEEAADRVRKLHDYKYYIHKRELFLKQLDEIYNVQVSQRQRFLLEKAINYLHREIGVSFSNRSEWSLTTALYYSGTVLTTIGLFLRTILIRWRS